MSSWTDEEVTAEAEKLGLPVPDGELAALATAVRRNAEMIARNALVIEDQMAPVLMVVPARRPGRTA